MAQKIISRTIGGQVDKQLSLANGSAARQPQILDQWTKLRVGFRLNVEGQAPIEGNPMLVLGLCSGTANKYGDPSTDHFFGVRTRNDATWSYDGGNSVFDLENPWEGVRKVNTTEATESASIAMGTVHLFSDAVEKRSGIFLEFEKGDPNWICRMITQTEPTAPDLDDALLQSCMDEANFENIGGSILTGYMAASQPVTLAVDEVANGVLNSINMFWNRTAFPMNFSDVRWKKIS